VPRASAGAGSAARVAGTFVQASASPTIPIGTLTRKIGRQPVPAASAETIAPPASWPTIAAVPAVAP
jgi:hypothetical protein